MKRGLVLAVICITSIFSSVQQKDSWTLLLDRKNIYSGVELNFNQKVPDILIASPALKSASVLEIDYKEAPTDIKWKRSFVFFDENNNVLARQDFDQSSGIFSIPASLFSKQLKNLKKLKLCAEQNPKNTDMMIRAKKVTIGNIVLQ